MSKQTTPDTTSNCTCAEPYPICPVHGSDGNGPKRGNVSDELSQLIGETLSEYSLHPQETHLENCIYWDGDTECDCSSKWEFNQYPSFVKDLAERLQNRENRLITKRCKTAYKQGYIAGGIDEILRHDKAREAVEAELREDKTDV